MELHSLFELFIDWHKKNLSFLNRFSWIIIFLFVENPMLSLYIQCIYLSLFAVSVAWASPEEVSLFHDLFQNYSTSALPSAKHNESVPVSLDVGLRQILDVVSAK